MKKNDWTFVRFVGDCALNSHLVVLEKKDDLFRLRVKLGMDNRTLKGFRVVELSAQALEKLEDEWEKGCSSSQDANIVYRALLFLETEEFGYQDLE